MAVDTSTNRVPDDELVRRIAEGHQPAFAELFRRLHPAVFRFALHMAGSVSTADDVVQDVFLIVMRDAGRYQSGRAAVTAWLCGIARNCIRQRMHRDRRLTPLDPVSDHERASDTSGPADPLAGLLRAERADALRRAVQTLPVPYREALVLCDLQEMTYEDAAQVLECPIGTVRSRLHRARALLATKVLGTERQGVEPRVDLRTGEPDQAQPADDAERAARRGGIDVGGCYV